jgi:hypothetical protein
MMRSLMRHRAVTERDAQTQITAYGHRAAPDWQPVGVIPCYAYSFARKLLADGAKEITLEDLRIAFPLRADVRDGDRVVRVTDRLYNTLIDGPMIVKNLQRRPDHQEAMVERVAGAIDEEAE